ncbi:MAG: hypothetical protein ACOYIK_10605 [Coriobacteriales bacterium]|jgi:hypothetical protein
MAEISVGNRALFFADTPVQILNSMYLASMFSAEGTISDLYVIDQFSNAQAYLHSARDSGLFSSVFDRKGKVLDSDVAVRMDNLRSYFRDPTPEIAPALLEKDLMYDSMFLSCPTTANYGVLSYLRRYNPKLRTYFYEDGTGTYTGNVFRGITFLDFSPEGIKERPFRKQAKTLVRKVVGKRGLYCVEALYVKRPSAMTFCPPMPVRQLRPTRQVLQLIKDSRLWSGGESLDKASVIIFDCLRSMRSNETDAAIVDEIVDLLDMHQLRYYLRLHPRTDANLAPNGNYFGVNGMWEVKCQVENMEDFLLVGMFSSAQLSPYLETGAQPHLLFLNRLRERNPDDLQTDAAVEELLGCMGYPSDRILFPSSIDETVSIIESFAYNKHLSSTVQ